MSDRPDFWGEARMEGQRGVREKGSVRQARFLGRGKDGGSEGSEREGKCQTGQISGERRGWRVRGE